ncbi:prolipoprotein diacylglyceryl transferase [Porcipelethomonas sp.]|uniref:prolipoprotein diacylglyceryl transferase n=1 Tax=Porcipelethomonas sp. TaxID=2981675 RepID=UPI003EF3ACAF
MTQLGNLEHDEIVFPKLGIDIHVSDTAFTIFGIDIKWYGIIITAGILLAMIYCIPQMKKYGIDSDRAIDAILGGIVGGLIGARAYYVIMSWDTYAGDWKSIFNFRKGGLAIYGGIIGAILLGGLIAKLRKVRLLPLLDIASIGFLLGQGIGRWGNFTNQEAFGYNTDSIFGMSGGKIQEYIETQMISMPSGQGAASMDPFMPVHPCFLYESVWCLLGFWLLALFAKKIRRFDGQILLIYMGWYGLGRFFIEGLRTDSLMIGEIRVSQALSAVLVIVSVILQVVIGLRVKRLGSDYTLYVNTEESKKLLEEAEKKSYESKNKKEKIQFKDVSDNIDEFDDDEISVNNEIDETKEIEIESEEE